jgi:hypothetical protein
LHEILSIASVYLTAERIRSTQHVGPQGRPEDQGTLGDIVIALISIDRHFCGDRWSGPASSPPSGADTRRVLWMELH